ncbi:immunoglobulin-binding protein 1b-like, partial [Pollicipes pollicipes]|uniref:immunoglobulin-binding protein 1b-like n=1 Tax=Pollicipes pollicipes TaxID=41117 RepID=UPI001884FF67
MASSEDTEAERSLSELFDHCMKLYTEVKDSKAPSNDPNLQSAVRTAICALEDLTRRVSAAGLFSTNEAADELPTSSLRFLLLPALLGELTSKLARDDRLQVISVAEVYYRDFVQRCRDYGLTDAAIPRARAEAAAEPARQPRPPTMRDLATMSKQREERLRRYRQQKELDKQLAALQEAMRRPSPDEETVRSYQLTLVLQAVSRAVDELNSLELEKPILEHMQQLKTRGGGAAPE